MNLKIKTALDRLNAVLPLAKNQSHLTPRNKHLHQRLLWSMLNHGQLPDLKDMPDISTSLQTLSDEKLIVLDESEHITGIYPFTTQQREHSISFLGHHVYAMCALDALAVAPMFEVETSISSQCRVTQSTIKIKQKNTVVLQGFDVYFGIDWSAASTTISCSESLCMEMLFLRDQDIAEQWLNESDDQRDIFNLTDAIEFGGLFFKPLIN